MEYYFFVFIKFLIGFTIVICYFNLSGKTQMSQLTPIDLIGNFIIGGIIGGVIYSDSIPVPQYIIVLIIGTTMMHLLNQFAKKFELFRSLTLGDPIIIIKNGVLQLDTIQNKDNKIDMINFLSNLHSRGISSLQDVHYAQIEPNGQLSIFKKEDPAASRIVILHGEIQKQSLALLEKDDEFIQTILSYHHIDIDKIFLAEYDYHHLYLILFNNQRLTLPLTEK